MVIQFTAEPQTRYHESMEQYSEQAIHYPKVGVKQVAQELWRGIRVHRLALWIMSGAIILANLASVAVPIFYKQFFDLITRGGDRTQLASGLFRIIVTIAVFNGIYWLLMRLAEYANNDFQPHVMASLRQQAYNYLMEHSYSFFANN